VATFTEPACPVSTIRFPNGSVACIPHPEPREHWSAGLAGAVAAAAVDLILAERQK
jgi:hypothetical protein